MNIPRVRRFPLKPITADAHEVVINQPAPSDVAVDTVETKPAVNPLMTFEIGKLATLEARLPDPHPMLAIDLNRGTGRGSRRS